MERDFLCDSLRKRKFGPPAGEYGTPPPPPVPPPPPEGVERGWGRCFFGLAHDKESLGRTPGGWGPPPTAGGGRVGGKGDVRGAL